MTESNVRLGPGGRILWDAVVEANELDEPQRVQLLEACRAKDRLDKLDEILRNDITTWARLAHSAREDVYEIRIDQALSQANATATQLKQLLASLRLPDAATGKVPQRRGSARAGYKTKTPAGVTALEKFRAAG